MVVLDEAVVPQAGVEEEGVDWFQPAWSAQDEPEALPQAGFGAFPRAESVWSPQAELDAFPQVDPEVPPQVESLGADVWSVEEAGASHT